MWTCRCRFFTQRNVHVPRLLPPSSCYMNPLLICFPRQSMFYDVLCDKLFSHHNNFQQQLLMTTFYLSIMQHTHTCFTLDEGFFIHYKEMCIKVIGHFRWNKRSVLLFLGIYHQTQSLVLSGV